MKGFEKQNVNVTTMAIRFWMATQNINEGLSFHRYFLHMVDTLEFVTGGVELLLKAVLHGYAEGLIFMK